MRAIKDASLVSLGEGWCCTLASRSALIAWPPKTFASWATRQAFSHHSDGLHPLPWESLSECRSQHRISQLLCACDEEWHDFAIAAAVLHKEATLVIEVSAVTHLHAIAMQVMTQTNTCEATMAAAAVLTHSRGQAAQPGPPIIPTKKPHHIIKGCGLAPDTRCANSIFAA